MASSRATLGDRHPNTLITVGNLADLLRERGALDEALAELGDAPRLAREVVGPTHEFALVLAVKAARIELARTANSAPLRAAVGRLEEALGTGHAQTQCRVLR